MPEVAKTSVQTVSNSPSVGFLGQPALLFSGCPYIFPADPGIRPVNLTVRMFLLKVIPAEEQQGRVR